MLWHYSAFLAIPINLDAVDKIAPAINPFTDNRSTNASSVTSATSPQELVINNSRLVRKKEVSIQTDFHLYTDPYFPSTASARVSLSIQDCDSFETVMKKLLMLLCRRLNNEINEMIYSAPRMNSNQFYSTVTDCTLVAVEKTILWCFERFLHSVMHSNLLGRTDTT